MSWRPRRRSRGGPMLARVAMHAARGTPAHVGLRDRVEAAFVKRMTPRDTPDRQPPAPARAETLDGLIAVVRAGGLVAARAHHSEERSDGHLVDPDEHQAGTS